MPIFLIKDWPIIASKSEFLSEYSKLRTNSRISREEELDLACKVMLDLYDQRELNAKDKSDWGMYKYSFSYSENEAREITHELLLFHSFFYGGFEIYDWDDKKINFVDFIRPFHYGSIKSELIKLVMRDLLIEFSLADVQRIQGVVNNFVIETEKILYFFSSTIYIKKRIRIVPNILKNKSLNSSIAANGASYIFDSNRPSKFKLRKYRIKDCLMIICQYSNKSFNVIGP